MLRHIMAAGRNAPLFFNMCNVVDIPDGCDLRRVLNSIRLILVRYETLRTTYHREDNGARQHVADHGELAVRLFEAGKEDARTVAEDVTADLVAQSFAGDMEWPIRFAVVLSAGRPVHLAVVYSHLAVDGSGALVISQEMSRLLEGGQTLPPPDWQPADQALHEQSPEGHAISHRALEYLSQVLELAPASMFDFPVQKRVADRAIVLEMRSQATMRATAMLAERLHVPRSSVLLAATAVVLGLYTGRTSAVMNMVATNRTREPQLSLAASLATDTVCLVDFTAQSFEQTVRRAFKASMSASLNSQCDPYERQAKIREHGFQLGRHICLDVNFNYVRTATIAGNEETANETLHSALERTEVIQQERPFGGAGFYLHVLDSGIDGIIMFIGDAWHVPRESMLEIIYAFERLLVISASRGIPATELASIAGIRAVERGRGWVGCPGGYVDLGAIVKLWRRVSAAKTAEVFVQASEMSDNRLIAYAYSPLDGRSVAELHRDFMAALEERTDVRAPDRYVLCLEAPSPHADQASWQGLPIRDEGSGR